MIPHLTPWHSPAKREFARGPTRFARQWKKELHTEDQSPLATNSTPSKPAHRADLSRAILIHHPGQRSANQAPKTFLKDSLRSTL